MNEKPAPKPRFRTDFANPEPNATSSSPSPSPIVRLHEAKPLNILFRCACARGKTKYGKKLLEKGHARWWRVGGWRGTPSRPRSGGAPPPRPRPPRPPSSPLPPPLRPPAPPAHQSPAAPFATSWRAIQAPLSRSSLALRGSALRSPREWPLVSGRSCQVTPTIARHVCRTRH